MLSHDQIFSIVMRYDGIKRLSRRDALLAGSVAAILGATGCSGLRNDIPLRLADTRAKLKLPANELLANAKGEEVAAVQTYLKRLGYLQDEHEERSFDKATVDALKHFQRFYNVKESGVVDNDTLKLLHARRSCGRPDVVPKRIKAHAQNPWGKNALKYWFANLSTSAEVNSTEKAKAAFDEGFALWNPCTGMVFTHANQQNGSDVRVEWKFPQCWEEALACTEDPKNGSMEYDPEVTWAKQLPIAGSSFDMVAFVGHEAGHALGITFEVNGQHYYHSPHNTDLMYAVVRNGKRKLGDGDIAAAKRIYK